MASSGPSTLGPAHPVSTGIPINYRIERNEQERERNLQSRYQVNIAHHLPGQSCKLYILSKFIIEIEKLDSS